MTTTYVTLETERMRITESNFMRAMSIVTVSGDSSLANEPTEW